MTAGPVHLYEQQSPAGASAAPAPRVPRIGLDSYSYHHLLGEVRAGERPPRDPFLDGSLGVLGEARRLGVDLVALETVFLPGPQRLDAQALRAAAGPIELALSWGHPEGLAWGRDTAALEDLLGHLLRAPELGCGLMRIVVAGPRLARDLACSDWLQTTAAAIDIALAEAATIGVRLAVENHGDLTVDALLSLLDRCPALGVCLDTANALRVSDDPVDAAERLRDHVAMVHLKDCEDAASSAPLAGPCSVAYGTGAIDVDGVLDALGGRLAHVPVCVELAQLRAQDDERGLVASCVAWLRRRTQRPSTTTKEEIGWAS